VAEVFQIGKDAFRLESSQVRSGLPRRLVLTHHGPAVVAITAAGTTTRLVPTPPDSRTAPPADHGASLIPRPVVRRLLSPLTRSWRSISVYDRVVVGSDGTATSLYAVDRAAEVAQAAQAKLVVVTAYRDGDAAAAAPGAHREIYGEAPARQALERTVTGLTRERARYIEQRLVPGDPAQALLDTVGANPANLIVVGNRGLGASEGDARLGAGRRGPQRGVRRTGRPDVGAGRGAPVRRRRPRAATVPGAAGTLAK